jgi:sulfite exporter TauE/SafE
VFSIAIVACLVCSPYCFLFCGGVSAIFADLKQTGQIFTEFTLRTAGGLNA